MIILDDAIIQDSANSNCIQSIKKLKIEISQVSFVGQGALK